MYELLELRGDRGTSGRLLLVAFADMESRMIRVGDAALHVGVTGHGPDVVVLTGGPGLDDQHGE